MRLYGKDGVEWWDGTVGMLGEDVGFERHGGEGVRPAYDRAQYSDHVESWKRRF